MPFTAIKPASFPWFDYSRYSFSLGLKTATGAYLSGHTASEYDPGTKRIVVRGSMTDQVRTAYAKIGAILEAAGLGYQDITRIVEYVRPEGLERYAETVAARNEVFGTHQPTVNTVPVTSLVRPDAYIEIEVTAGSMGAATPMGPGMSPARDSAGVVFLPSVQPVDDQGNIIGAGDLMAQARAIFGKAQRMLAALGLDFSHVVKTNDYLTTEALAGYAGAMRTCRAFFGPVHPAATGIVMPRLVHPQALIQCDLIATRDTPVAVNPGWDCYRTLACSPAVKAGKLLFMSGQGALDPTSGHALFDGDIVAQTEYIYQNILKLLEAAGGGLPHLAKTIEYVAPAGLARYREVAGVRARLLREPFPASTGLLCEALLQPEMQIAVDPFAILD